MTPHIFIKFLLIASVTLSFFFVSSFVHAQNKEKPPTSVIVLSVYKDNFLEKIEAIGTLRANESIVLTSTVTEIATAINFTDGQRVKKGDILIEMTNKEEKSLLDQQRALVNEANQQLKRTRELVESGASPKALLDERQRDYTSAKGALGALQSRLEDHIIVAPFDGVVGLRNLSPGTLLQPGMSITTLDDDSVMKLDFSVPSIFLPNLTPGLKIMAKSSGYEEIFEGEITAIDSQIDEITRSVSVRAILPNPKGNLKPGLLMTVEIQKKSRENICVPESAIIPEGRKHFVFVVTKDKDVHVVQKREVKIGIRKQGFVEILSGLSLDEKVVTQGSMMVRDGAKVTIIAEQKREESLDDLLDRISKEKKDSKGVK